MCPLERGPVVRTHVPRLRPPSALDTIDRPGGALRRSGGTKRGRDPLGRGAAIARGRPRRPSQRRTSLRGALTSTRSCRGSRPRVTTEAEREAARTLPRGAIATGRASNPLGAPEAATTAGRHPAPLPDGLRRHEPTACGAMPARATTHRSVAPRRTPLRAAPIREPVDSPTEHTPGPQAPVARPLAPCGSPSPPPSLDRTSVV